MLQNHILKNKILKGTLLGLLTTFALGSALAGAADFYLEKKAKGTQEKEIIENDRTNQKTKEFKKPDLFVHENKGLSSLWSGSSVNKVTNRPPTFSLPGNWGMLDAKTKEIKAAETKRVTKELAENEAQTAASNQKNMQDAKDRIAKSDAEERGEAVDDGKTKGKKKGLTEEEIQKYGKKGKKSMKANVIKRKNDPTKGAPRKLFNDPNQ